MDFNYYEKVKKNIIDEYNNNLEKINDLNKKINLLEWDNVYNKLTRVFAFSVVPWIIGLIFIITNKINFNIPISVISFLSMSSPILIGGVIEKIVSRFATGQILVIAGGLIETKQEITNAIKCGAVAVSTGKQDLWIV